MSDAGAGVCTIAGVASALAEARVLVVDDDPANVILLDHLLRRAGASRVTCLTDSRAVVDHVRALQPDLILLDLNMPHLDGVAVLEALSAVVPAELLAPVLVLTADATEDAKRRALEAGAKDFVTKPFQQTEVLLRIRNLLETRALQLALHRQKAALCCSDREER